MKAVESRLATLSPVSKVLREETPSLGSAIERLKEMGISDVTIVPSASRDEMETVDTNLPHVVLISDYFRLREHAMGMRRVIEPGGFVLRLFKGEGSDFEAAELITPLSSRKVRRRVRQVFHGQTPPQGWKYQAVPGPKRQ